MAAPKRPEGLGKAGAALWTSVASRYQLRPDELAVLTNACRMADEIAVLQAGMVGQPLLVTGSQHQTVIHPLIPELRQQRSALAALLRQLKLPDDETVSRATSRSVQNRANAQARWGTRA